MFVASIAIGLSRKIGKGFTLPARNILPSSNVISCARPTANVGTSILPPRLTHRSRFVRTPRRCLQTNDDRGRRRLIPEKQDRPAGTVRTRAISARCAAQDRLRTRRASFGRLPRQLIECWPSPAYDPRRARSPLFRQLLQPLVDRALAAVAIESSQRLLACIAVPPAVRPRAVVSDCSARYRRLAIVRSRAGSNRSCPMSLVFHRLYRCSPFWRAAVAGRYGPDVRG